jgi:hypothetical protein
VIVQAIDKDDKGQPIVTIGNDVTIQRFVTTGPAIKVTGQCNAGDLFLVVEPLVDALLNDDMVRFGQVVATLSADAPAGSTALAIDALAGFLTPGMVGGKVQDITGWTIEMSWRRDPTQLSSAILLSKVTGGGGIVRTNEPLGVYEYLIARGDTVNIGDDSIKIGPGAYYYAERRTDAGAYTPLAEGPLQIYLIGAH